VQCPRCWSLERHRLLAHFLDGRPELLAGDPFVLHFAPELAVQRTLARWPLIRYLSADLESELAMERMDITAIPLGDATVDVVLASQVLEHVPDDRRALRELYRVLRPGGLALVLSPIEHDRETTFEDPAAVTPERRAELFGQFDHVRSYGLDFPQRLAEAGFRVVVEDHLGELDEETIERHRLRHVGRFGPDEIFLCERPGS
jgi:SAM-dependent methyltransferase